MAIDTNARTTATAKEAVAMDFSSRRFCVVMIQLSFMTEIKKVSEG